MRYQPRFNHEFEKLSKYLQLVLRTDRTMDAYKSNCVGCGTCCKVHHPIIYDIEAKFLLSGLELLTTQTKKDIKKKSSLIANDFKKLKIKYNDIHWLKQEEKFPFECPLLKDNKCALYAYRPIACRLYSNSVLEDGYFWGCESEILR